MAKMYSSGPALMYISTPVGYSFLGSAESAPDIELTGEFEPVYSDIAGSRLPMDRIFEGEEAVISAVLTWWDESTLNAINTFGAALGSVDGRSFFHDTGTIMGQEGANFEFFVRFPFAAKPAYSDMPAGYHFLSAMRIGGFRIEPGTKVNKRHLIIKAQRKLNPAIGAPGLNTEIFRLYDFDMSAVANIPIG